jgi:3D (Asp-Asp-Asp) domain-containing protein
VNKPAPKVIAVGTGSGARIVAASATHQAIKPAPKGGRRMRVEASGYAPGSGGADNRTATGAKAVRGVIAVDPHVIPLGTHVYVPGYGYAVAADTGGAIHGNRIDLCFGSYAEAIAWGRRSVTIIILD